MLWNIIGFRFFQLYPVRFQWESLKLRYQCIVYLNFVGKWSIACETFASKCHHKQKTIFFLVFVLLRWHAHLQRHHRYMTGEAKLPVLKQSQTHPLDPTVACTFCRSKSESLVYLLLECQHVQPILAYIASVIKRLSGTSLTPTYSLRFALSAPLLVHFSKHITLLITTTRHKI